MGPAAVSAWLWAPFTRHLITIVAGKQLCSGGLGRGFC